MRMSLKTPASRSTHWASPFLYRLGLKYNAA